jgi:hypothetical protein
MAVLRATRRMLTDELRQWDRTGGSDDGLQSPR